MMVNPNLESLAFEFFREFARYEYCLKAVGLRKEGRDAHADWRLYANAPEIVRLFETREPKQFSDAVAYYLERPPKKQIVSGDGTLDWDPVLPTHKNNSELVLLLICRARNNLFHGGKFNGHWFEPQRSLELLSHGLAILAACAEAHPKVREAYASRAL